MSILQMSIYGAVMILAVIVIRAVAMNRLPKKTFIALWGVVLLRLLVPFSFPSPFSAYSIVNNHIPATQRAAALGNANIFPIVPTELATIGSDLQGRAAVSISPYAVVWGIGMIACALFFAVAYFKCRREFRESLPIDNEFLTSWLAGHKLTRRIEIRQSSRVSAPLTYGVFKPIILLPKSTRWEDTTQLEYILTHEFVHVRRFDAATKLLLTAALCVHWFNPLVWAMYVLSNRDLELSCDEAVVRSFGDTTRSAYALTLISMVEKKNTLTPLCNNFSKNAIEERITAIMRLKKTTLFALVAAIAVVVGVSIAFATSAATDTIPSADKTFGDYERQKLEDFQFAGYQEMTIADYQERAWLLKDTSDYHEVLERISHNNMLYKMRDSNDNASFLFYTLEPLTAEGWQTRDFSGYTQAPNGDVQGDHATLEYQVSLTISDASRLTVGEYEQARQGVMAGLQQFLQGKTDAELQDESGMDSAILAEIAALKSKWETPALKIAVKPHYIPLSLYENPSDYIPNSSEQEKRPYPHASTADYQSLLKLKTADYHNQSVLAFNAALLEWANEDFERNERVNIDRAWNDFEVELTDEERRFVTLTAWASGVENSELVQSDFTGKEKDDPSLGNFDLTKEANDSNRIAWASLFYQLTYHIPDETKLTVGERDRVLAGVINEIQQYWDNQDIDTLLMMNDDSILKEVKVIAANHSNELVKISFENDSVHFECMSEPKAQN